MVEQVAYRMTFDYINNFSEPVKFTEHKYTNTLYGNKLYYFEATHEYVFASLTYTCCKIYIIHFSSNFTVKYEGEINPSQTCWGTNTFSLVLYSSQYTVLIDDTTFLKIIIYEVNETGIIENIEQPVTNYNVENEEYETENVSTQTIEISTIPSTEILGIFTTIILDNPTTEITDIPTTEITNIPSTIITDIPTTEITNIPSTIITNIPTTEITNIPTTIIINIPTTEIINNPTTIITNIPTMEITNIATTIITNTPTSIITNNFTTSENDNQIITNNKCKKATQESLEYNLCLECNTENNYFPVYKPNDEFFHGFIECYNNSTKQINFYLDKEDNIYKPCYETCLTCEIGGNEYINNCLTCASHYIKRPESPGTTNCVSECNYFYYFTSYGQYKCTNDNYCPDEAKLYVNNLKKCTNDCNKQGEFIYQYGGECLKNCPENSTPNENNICIDSDLNSCVKSENEIDLYEFLSSGSIDFNAKQYAIEFNYTNNHLSHYYNSLYSIIIYKDVNCIDKLSIDTPKVDFGDCFTKIQNNLSPPSNNKIIVALVAKKNINKKSITSYSFYHPDTGEKIDSDSICKDEEVIVKESVLSQLNDSSVNYESALFLVRQNVDIFDLSSAFYNDICYHFESLNGRDIPLKERVHIYYPNITLCEDGCNSKGVNLTSMETICECKFNILNNDIVEGNALLENTLGEITDLLSNSNLDVLKCFKDVFNIKYISKGIGGFIILGILFFQIIFSIKLLIYDINMIIRYLYNLTEIYISFTEKKKKHQIF